MTKIDFNFDTYSLLVKMYWTTSPTSEFQSYSSIGLNSTLSGQLGSNNQCCQILTDFPPKRIGAPWVQIGSPWLWIGTPWERIGTPSVPIGKPCAQIHTSINFSYHVTLEGLRIFLIHNINIEISWSMPFVILPPTGLFAVSYVFGGLFLCWSTLLMLVPNKL